MEKSILLVDDDEVFHLLSNRLLQRLGITSGVHTARNGQEALNFITSRAPAEGPDVIFLDLNMPIMNGFSFIEALQRQDVSYKDRVVIVIVSSSQDPQDLSRAKELGIQYYLTKPITEANVRELLSSIGML